MFSQVEREKLLAAAAILREAERPVRVLRSVAWPQGTAERFLAAGGREMPEVRYQPLDASPVAALVTDARRLIQGTSPVHSWLRRIADTIDTGAQMLATVGTKGFFHLSRVLYGDPMQPLADGVTTAHALALRLDEILNSFSLRELGEFQVVQMSAEEAAAELTREMQVQFNDRAPPVQIVDELSANALAGARYVRVRRSATFTDRDVRQLIQHELMVHIATSLNGQEQRFMPILAAGHPGTTRTQEGLAVASEFITGVMDPDRLRRLADRVLAIQMAIEGADFLDLYRFFLERTHSPQHAFENARRVQRGGVLEGGAPFTKDIVYLDGLLRVHTFLLSVIQFGRIDCLRLLFCGKLDIEDIPVLCVLAEQGVCQMPRFLPAWARDLRFLVSHLAYSSFLNRVDLGRVQAHYAELLADAPRIAIEDIDPS
jgi:uncharacterized protein (TIGR02421 family)